MRFNFKSIPAAPANALLCGENVNRNALVFACSSATGSILNAPIFVTPIIGIPFTANGIGGSIELSKALHGFLVCLPWYFSGGGISSISIWESIDDDLAIDLSLINDDVIKLFDDVVAFCR